MCSSVVACAVKIHELFRLQNDYNSYSITVPLYNLYLCAHWKQNLFFTETTTTEDKENNILECIKMILYNPKLLHVW